MKLIRAIGREITDPNSATRCLLEGIAILVLSVAAFILILPPAVWFGRWWFSVWGL